MSDKPDMDAALGYAKNLADCTTRYDQGRLPVHDDASAINLGRALVWLESVYLKACEQLAELTEKLKLSERAVGIAQMTLDLDSEAGWERIGQAIASVYARAETAERERDEARRVAEKAYQDEDAADRVAAEARRLLAEAYKEVPLDEEAAENRWLIAVTSLSQAASGDAPSVPWSEVRAEIAADEARIAAELERDDARRVAEVWQREAGSAMAREDETESRVIAAVVACLRGYGMQGGPALAAEIEGGEWRKHLPQDGRLIDGE